MSNALILVAVLAFLALGFLSGAIEALSKLFDSVPWTGIAGLMILAAASAWYLHH